MKIRDLVDVPEIRTVIQMEDLKDPELRSMILQTFVLTSEVLNNLRSVFTSLCGGKGRGIFLKGHFGSGKSHFLSTLSTVLRYPSAWEPLLDQSPPLHEFAQRLKSLRFLVVDISLVQHRGSEFLEDIVLRAVLEELGEDLAERLEGSETRKDAFQKMKAVMEGKGFQGMALLMDELSEFLRSKGDARAFNEDIRFLQYLGEEAGDFPLWVVASLQEWIEETGEIHQDSFNKIKDRYPVRLKLGRAHIEELVSERLIRHKDGAEARIEAIYERLKGYFPTFPVALDRFARLYPVHPGTSTLLDRLKPLFSEHRGVVDFIHFRLKGDPERHIPSMLDLPAHRLLTPEAVFDHFLERIRERSETQVFVERVYESYRDEIPQLFQDRDQQMMALVLIKLLILFALSPVKFKYTVRHTAEMALFQVTSMEAEVNYQFVLDLLERLEKEGSYVRVESRDDPFDNHYYIDLKADVGGIMRKKIRHAASGIFAEDRRLFWKTAAMVDAPFLPLGKWVEQERQMLFINWQHTRRSGILLLRQLDELSQGEMEGLSRQWQEGEEDFFLLVGTTHHRDRQARHVRDQLLPRIRKKHRGTFLFWIPADPEGDAAWLKEFLAAVLLLEGTDREFRAGQEEFLSAFVEKEKHRVTEHFIRCYFHGALVWDENQIALSRYGQLSQEKFLAEFIPPLLDRRFSKHSRIQPYMDALFPGILKEMLMGFLSSGMLLVDDHSKFGIRDILEGLLKPMGLVRKKGNLYELHVNPKQNELARHFFDLMGDRESVTMEDMYRAFRKGDYGLMEPHFEILVLALIFSGHLVAHKIMKRKPPDELVHTGLKGVTSLSRGEILEEELREALIDHPLIPRKFKQIPFTLAVQEDLWAHLRSQKAATLEDLKGLRSKIQWAAAFEAFKRMPWEKLDKDLEALMAHWEEIKVSFPSKAGLERFMRFGHGDPFLGEKLKSVQDVRAFLEQAERALFVYQYMTDQGLLLLEKTPYMQVDEDRMKGVKEGAVQDGYGEMRQCRAGILEYFGGTSPSISAEDLEALFNRFQAFRDAYARIYVAAHRKARGGPQFEPYEQLTRSPRYRVLHRFDQLEMISVQHDRRSIDRGISSVLVQRCQASPQDHLQNRPVCACGFRLGEERPPFKPLRALEEEMDRGIRETLEALKSAGVQEKLLPYLEGLDQVGKGDEADAVRQLLALSEGETDFLNRLDGLAGRRVIGHINEAFRGKVVVVKRNLDRLYQSLIHRKYTLTQLRKIFRDWLQEEDLSGETFLHFVGAGGGGREPAERARERLQGFLGEAYGHLAGFYRELGHARFIRVMFTAHWAALYGLPAGKILALHPDLDRGGEEAGEKRIRDLAELARGLHAEKPGVFESIVSELEEDTAFTQALWSSLNAFSPEEIFTKETLFSSVLKEAFERLLCGKPDKAGVEALDEEGAFKSHGGPFLGQQKNEMACVLRDCHRFRESLAALKPPKTSGPDDFPRWESLFRQHMAPLPALINGLFEAVKRVGVAVPPFMKQERRTLKRRVEEMTAVFAGFYGQALPLWERAEGRRPLMIQDMPSILSKKRGVPDHRGVHYILMDGMRWDLWEKIKSGFFGKMTDQFRFVREGALWTHQPSDTAAQMERFSRAFHEVHGDGGKDLLWKISEVDEKIHTEKGPLSHLFANVLSFLELELLYRLRGLPSRTLIILFADHGFVENPGFNPTDKYGAPRYIHGKDSPFEVIVPWAWVMRI